MLPEPVPYEPDGGGAQWCREDADLHPIGAPGCALADDDPDGPAEPADAG